MALNNNQINTILNEVYKEITGQEASKPITAKDIVDTGNDANVILTSKEQFTKALINRIAMNMFTDTAYEGDDDEFWVDSSEYGAIVQIISVQAPEVQESHAWRDISSGVTTAGQYTLFTPIINAQLFGRSVSWELPICITNEQWDTAVTNEEELMRLVNYVFLSVDSKIKMHLESLNMTNRNNFIAEKIDYATKNATKTNHVINLVKKYHDEVDSTITTADAFLKNADALRYATKELSLYMDYMRKPTTLFNTSDEVKFVPKERMVCEILSEFKKTIDSVALSTTFNDNYVALPYHKDVPFWQTPQASAGEQLTFDAVSRINVQISENTTIEKSGIVAFICDKWAIMHTLIKHRVASTYFDPEAVTQYYYQFNDRYINNLSLNAVVFTLEDLAG